MSPEGFRWHKKSSWIGTQLFLLYILHFCQGNELPAKTLLLLGYAPCFPAKNLHEDRMPLDVNIVYMPSNTTSLFQTMDQGVIATFKACLLLLPNLHGNGESFGQVRQIIKDYWCSFDILKGIKIISTAWKVVSVNYLNGVWCKPLPEFMHYFTRFQPVENIVEDITKLT